MYKLIYVIEILLQSSFINPIESYYNWIVILCTSSMYGVWFVMTGFYIMSCYVFIYFDMFYIQYHHLAKKDLWNNVY
jgi:hypothetical protein